MIPIAILGMLTNHIGRAEVPRILTTTSGNQYIEGKGLGLGMSISGLKPIT